MWVSQQQVNNVKMKNTVAEKRDNVIGIVNISEEKERENKKRTGKANKALKQVQPSKENEAKQREKNSSSSAHHYHWAHSSPPSQPPYSTVVSSVIGWNDSNLSVLSSSSSSPPYVRTVGTDIVIGLEGAQKSPFVPVGRQAGAGVPPLTRSGQ